MASKQDIQFLIDQIQPGVNYRANQMRPLLTDMLDFSSAIQTQVFDGLIANGTTESTTLVLGVGVNIVVTSTETDYACKLPQPVTGQRVTVVNKSNNVIYLFPSNVGGQINNYPIDTPAIIPPDGKAYDFICIENPLPGAWVWSPPAINQYDTGELSLTTTSSSNNNNIIASNQTYIAERTSLFINGIVANNGLNQPSFPPPITPSGSLPNSDWYVAFRPSNNWNAITKIKVYTNIVPGDTPEACILSSVGINLYDANTTNLITGTTGGMQFAPFFNLSNTVSGVGTPGLSTNIGDPGTAWGEYDGPFDISDANIGDFSFVGNKFISTNGTEDLWFTKYISLVIKPKVIGAVKFQFFLEYF